MDITVAADFPKAEYMEVMRRLSEYLDGLRVNAGTVAGFRGCAGGWNAVILRFRAACEDCDTATELLAPHQGKFTNDDRYQQERALMGFFVNAQSTIESCCFGIYHIGRMRNPSAFSRDERFVNPSTVYTDFTAAYPTTSLTAELGNLRNDATWVHIKRIRSILFHRMHPGRTIFMSTVGSPPPPPDEWTGLGIVLEPALVTDPRTWLATAVSRLVRATLEFVETYF